MQMRELSLHMIPKMMSVLLVMVGLTNCMELNNEDGRYDV